MALKLTAFILCAMVFSLLFVKFSVWFLLTAITAILFVNGLAENKQSESSLAHFVLITIPSGVLTVAFLIESMLVASN